jgi:chitin synthase
MYRLRTVDKGKPLIIADQVIDEYSDIEVDTLHKKNLLSLGEDRYLTTLMTKHFPAMSYKFVPDAYAETAAPETWSVLLSQRRRWINSTIHNLAELVFLKDLCGFCCFSMRFVVFIDLFGTIILPATCTYLGYLIYRVATHSGQFPLISIILIAVVYGLQALIFIIKRQWQHVGWMIIYLIAYPIYSFILPIYSFWKQDDFSWGNTRIVISERSSKQVAAMDDEAFDPRSILLQRWDDYATVNNLPGRRGNRGSTEKPYQDGYVDSGYEMDDIRSVYSSVKPASTILTGFPQHAPTYMPPRRSPGPPGNMMRQSTHSSITRYTDQPQHQPPRAQSAMGGMMEPYRDHVPAARMSMPALEHRRASSRMSLGPGPSQENLMSMSPPPVRQSRSPLGISRPVSTADFRGIKAGPDEPAITEAIRGCLAEVDLDSVTKKQGRWSDERAVDGPALTRTQSGHWWSSGCRRS